MKKYILLGWILVSALLHCQNWQTVNNTNHIFDIEKTENRIFFSSWGGVVEIEGTDSTDLSNWSAKQELSTGNGLVSNDIRTIALIDFSESLWMGSSNDGINILSTSGLQNLDEDLGLPSLRVNHILETESHVLVATSHGLAVFYYLSGVEFPLMLHQYNSLNTSGALPDNNIYDMMLTDDKMLFMAHDNGISYVHLDSLEVNAAWKSLYDVFPLPNSDRYILSSNSEHLAVAANGKIYVGNNDLSNTSWQTIRPYESTTQWDISDILLSDDGNLWVAFGKWNNDVLHYTSQSDTLLAKVHLQDLQTEYWYKNSDGFEYNQVSCIKEFDGDVYLGTWGNGIARYRDNQWQFYNPNNISFPKITISKTDNNNALWFGSGLVGDAVSPKGTLGVSAYKDGHWYGFDRDNSPLHSNNILALEVDDLNRKWFGAWYTSTAISGNRYGLTVYDEVANTWQWIYRDGSRMWDEDAEEWGDPIPNGPKLITSTIGGIYKDLYGNILVLCYDGGVSVFNQELEVIKTFELKNATFQRVLNAYHNGRQYFFGTEYDNGLSIWNDDSLPESDGDHWLTNIVPDLQGGKIYGVTSVQVPYSPSGWQHFIAAGTGLYMWNEYDWYKYDVYIKRSRYSQATNTWINDTLYYADEERLFGSESTYPLCIYGDPFGRVWIGSEGNGLSMYDPIRERFTNYYKGNAPLISNQIISLGYDPLEGRLLIGTSDGLNTFRIGKTVKPKTSLNTLKAYPNPFRPDGYAVTQIVNLPIDSMPAGDNQCRIFSASGQLIKELKENPFARFEWDGKNEFGNIVSSGIYFFVVTDANGETAQGKIAVIH